MASKKHLLGGVTLKVENMSGFDKSHFNALTAPLGAIVPLVKQLMLPGKGKLSLSLSAQLPPLATDAFLRSHLKVEAFLVPMRHCYGGFQSWFAGEKVIVDATTTPVTLGVAKLPFLRVGCADKANVVSAKLRAAFGASSLADYLGIKWPLDSTGNPDLSKWPLDSSSNPISQDFNIFPFTAYQLCYHHWYRNKLIQRPLFADASTSQTYLSMPSSLPYLSFATRKPYEYWVDSSSSDLTDLLNGSLLTLRQRNYGFDYFTTALPSAQDGSPMSVDTSAGSFTISALRLSNSLQQFAERNQVAGPDYIQVLRARYNRAPSAYVAQRPILLGSADFPMFSSGVEQTAGNSQSTQNPFSGIAARYGRAHAEGSDFVCEFDCDEPSYLIVNVSLVPEANYAEGISHDMRLFTREGSIVDLPCAELERAGMEPIYEEECGAYVAHSGLVFGYQPRFMWHKAGSLNQVHGLFRQGASLESFIPQRRFLLPPTLSSAFLEVGRTDLDNVMAVSGSLSQYGVMIDSKIDLFVSEPLGESVMPSLVDPGAEHGSSVYVSRGGISVNQ